MTAGSKRRVRVTAERLRRALLDGEARGNDRVVVAASFFRGHGLFAKRRFDVGEELCRFRGLAARMSELERGDKDVLRRAYEYSFCDPDVDLCAVPLRALKELRPLPPSISGCLANEATAVEGVGDFAANAVVDFSDRNAFEPSEHACPYLLGPYLEWPLRALRRVYPGEELLICYGSAYSARAGYAPASACGRAG